MTDERRTKRMLDLAARVAWRAWGDTDPNPLVGCVIAREGGRGDEIIGIGHHRRFGGLHAEREALADCRRRGHDPKGATLYCTLEPCRHVGKQPPCTEAVIEAGIARVVYARRDPGHESGGGCAVLETAGVESVCSDASMLATRLSDPFICRVRENRPWVIAKWAQTLDGKIATRTGESQWITGPLMRRRVHRLRSRVDAVLVGSGTAAADDPMLTARDVRRVRRVATRVVLDTGGRLSHDSALVRTAGQTPTVVVTASEATFPASVRVLRVGRGGDGVVDVTEALGRLWTELGVASVLVEAGPRVLGSLLQAGLIDEAFVHIAPMVLGDAEAMSVAVGRTAPRLTDGRRLSVVRARALGEDVELWCRRRGTGQS
ncbi:MAG: bifunctional diaminohydroxyphosphoribosylaminopyrimidine deaminase/5-amino-6-(5-phosphoribosylamino)uracil reductase RibD [Phycisphaerales bacterium]|nr:bifunctional diaminohydroxyphosphoribosylaminopyrimidine deaminase/5-amino-6-(5-phosphoribosylamino)uracil reductase RibD [Planctomycetota bacterium]MCH8508755.1 bifunctional diaminohydroxyphosphoribosylaminopyrimidine deaminase/5-amino-6-(5-phosphoribosylamino)uracil reductase RibD [Phycisphaerales bacterium]